MTFIPENINSENQYPPLTIRDLNIARQRIIDSGDTFKILVLTSPDNPTGAIYPLKTLIEIAEWCILHDIHLVVNEIYALSVINTNHSSIASDYAEKYQFESFLGYMKEMKSNYLHWWYSLSKDFGISGFRVGVVHSYNTPFIEGYSNINAPNMVSNHTQWLLQHLFDDDSFIEEYILINQKRLTESYVVVINALKEVNVPYIPSRGSLFVWVDLSQFLSENTQSAENSFWLKLYHDTGLLITPGEGFGHSNKGFFRIVYTCVSTNDLKVAFKRFKAFIKTL